MPPGDTPQHPPMRRAPSACQRCTVAAANPSALPRHARASASQVRPSFGYATSGSDVTARGALEERLDERRVDAVEADRNDLLERCRRGNRILDGVPSAISRSLRQVKLIHARDPGWPRKQASDDGGLVEARNRLDRKQVGAGIGEHREPRGVKRGELSARDPVVAAILAAVCQGGPKGPDRCGDKQRRAVGGLGATSRPGAPGELDAPSQQGRKPRRRQSQPPQIPRSSPDSSR